AALRIEWIIERRHGRAPSGPSATRQTAFPGWLLQWTCQADGGHGSRGKNATLFSSIPPAPASWRSIAHSWPVHPLKFSPVARRLCRRGHSRPPRTRAAEKVQCGCPAAHAPPRNVLFAVRHAPLAAIARLAGAFLDVDVAIDPLQVGQAPIAEQRRPRLVATLAPDLEQRHAMIYLGGLPQPAAALGAAVKLHALEELDVIARRVPELPRHHAGGVPLRLAVRTRVPQVDMPAERIDLLPADAAEAGTAPERSLAIGRGRRAERRRQVLRAAGCQTPDPALGGSAPGRERARQAVGAHRVLAPVGIDREPRHRRGPGPGKGVNEHRLREDFGQGLVEPRERP